MIEDDDNVVPFTGAKIIRDGNFEAVVTMVDDRPKKAKVSEEEVKRLTRQAEKDIEEVVCRLERLTGVAVVGASYNLSCFAFGNEPLQWMPRIWLELDKYRTK
jgi:hypothetical protein